MTIIWFIVAFLFIVLVLNYYSNAIWNKGICPVCSHKRKLHSIAVDPSESATFYWYCKCPNLYVTGEERFKQYCKIFKTNFTQKKISQGINGEVYVRGWNCEQTCRQNIQNLDCCDNISNVAIPVTTNFSIKQLH